MLRKKHEDEIVDQIPLNATIATVWPLLTYPRQYVANVRHKMKNCFEKHGNSSVRIGVTGTGQKPCFRVFYKLGGSDAEIIFGSYWDNLNPLEKEDVLNTNWSASSMSYEEVDAFLKEKVGWKKNA
jgi:hypothetical protein